MKEFGLGASQEDENIEKYLASPRGAAEKPAVETAKASFEDPVAQRAAADAAAKEEELVRLPKIVQKTERGWNDVAGQILALAPLIPPFLSILLFLLFSFNLTILADYSVSVLESRRWLVTFLSLVFPSLSPFLLFSSFFIIFFYLSFNLSRKSWLLLTSSI